VGHSGVNMPVNANILAQFAQPVRSVNDYMADYERQDANKLAGQRNALMLQGAQADMADRERTRAESETISNVLASLGGGATVEKQAQALRATGLPTALSQAAAFEKSALERRNIESQAAEREAKTNAEKYGLKRKQLEHGVQWLQVAQSPQQAAQMFTDGVRKGYWGMQDAQQQVATIPQDPAQFQQWKQQQLAQILDAEKQLPTLVAEDQGGSRLYGARNRFTGALTKNEAVPITQSANNAATVGASYANAAATRDAAKLQADATRAAANSQRDRETEMKLADDYRAQSKDFAAATSAYEQINAALKTATKSPVATLAAATKFMKIIDPGSVVRESELGMALAATGALDRIQNYVNTLALGKVLTESQAADFDRTSRAIYGAAQSVQKQIDADYTKKAKTYNLRPEMVTQELGQNAKAVNWGDMK